MSEDVIVYVVDDDEAIRRSVRRLLEQVELPVETFASPLDFLNAHDPDRVGCLVLDVRMPGMSGIDLQKRMIEDETGLPVIIVTGHGDIQMAVDSMRRGAIDFLEKPYRAQALLDSIHRALALDRVRHEERRIARELSNRFTKLTAREREVVAMVVKGLTNREIASRVGVSPQAIDARRARAMGKLGVATVPELVEFVLRYECDRQGHTLPPLGQILERGLAEAH